MKSLSNELEVILKAIQDIITNQSAEAYNEGFKDGYINGGIHAYTDKKTQ